MFQLLGSRRENLVSNGIVFFVVAIFHFFPHSPLGFFQVDYAFVGDDTLTDKPDWVKGNPQRVPSNANWG